MLKFKKWLAILLTVSIMMNTIPVSALAGEPSTGAGDPALGLLSAQNDQETNGDGDAPAADPPVADTPVADPPADDTPVVDTPVVDTPVVDTPADDTPADDTPAGDTPAVDTPAEAEEDGSVLLADVSEYNGFQDAFANKFATALIGAGLATAENIKDIISETDSKYTLKIADKNAAVLILLSRQEQNASGNYQDWTINFDITGNLDLTGTLSGSSGLTFQGLGDAGFPFKGTFTGNINSIKASQTIFKELSATADLLGVNITWVGSKGTPILASKLVADTEARSIAMPLASTDVFSPYIGELAVGAGLVTLPMLNYSAATANDTDPIEGNLGLVCNHMGSNTQLQISALQLPAKVDLRGTENVGGLIGLMDQNAALIITEPLTLNVYLEGKNTGGLAGQMDKASIRFENSVGVTLDAELKATESAGGIVGVVVTETGPLPAANESYTAPNVTLQSVKANGSKNSGVLYGSCTATGDFKPFKGVSFGADPVCEVSGPANCGGVFGTLVLQGSGKCTIAGTEAQHLSISSTLSKATNNTGYGGIAGELSGDARANALVVDCCDITSTIAVGTDSQNYPKYLGGIVANHQTVTLDAANSKIFVNDPKTQDADNCAFGGVAASVGNNTLLLVKNMTIQTSNNVSNVRGGSVVGLTGIGSIVYLQGSLDLSVCPLTSNANSGQIVGKQNCSLIYAPGVTITRYSNDLELDDIGNYGELYRIAGLMTVGENYAVSFPNNLRKTGEEYILSRPLDYACLALAWQSRGRFSTVDGIDNSNWATLKNSTISLSADITMKDCGIGGLTRDVYSTDDTFSGTFKGNDHTLTLDIGEKNAANSVTTGDGRIYRHNATGLFAALDSSKNVSNLTLAGSIRLSNNQQTAAMYSGALAAQVTGSETDNSMLSKVSTCVKYDAKVKGGNPLYLGGLIGQITGSNTKITFDTGTTLATEITMSGTGYYNHIGGAIGAISESSNASITCDGASLGGKIETTNKVDNMYAGGLVGTILPGSGTRKIDINSLTVDGFTLTGKASERMGGILGGIWADADVTIDGLAVTNTTLTSSGEAALGGLVYRASGKWTVNNIDLGGLTINAGSAKALGLMVCHGEPYSEPINGSKAVGGLYLEMAEHWDWIDRTKKGYKVPKNITFGSGVFDEFVAYTAAFAAQITHNGNGIISLQTDNDTVNMDTAGARNTYVNRTSVKKLNPNSRYYYNLGDITDEVKQSSAPNTIDTAKELLIWSVYRYAAINLQKHFSIDGVNTSTIGGSSSTQRAYFDMNGLSYYPIDLTDEDLTVQYADVTFYNNNIETKETETENQNKSTLGTDSTHTQHYTMHCALFNNFTAENIKVSGEKTLKVNGVGFAGSVGVVNGGSGALLCGRVAGQNNGTYTSVCKVVLAEEDKSTEAVKLEGISVVPEGDYTPVLINRFEDHSALEVNYITTAQTTKAGSSLFGKVEKHDATSAVNIAIVLEGTVKLNETENPVFSQATFFHSLHFSDGSASYNFNKDKDYDASNRYLHNATHGKELATSVEFYELQGNYLDGDPITANGVTPDFTGYLPYVAHSPATGEEAYKLENNWHEVAVNVRFSNLIEGCGTYGHPYMVDESTLRSVANYINSGRATNGWELRIPVDLVPPTYHTQDNASHDVVVTYKNGVFWRDKKPYSGDIRAYLQGAFYQIKEDIMLNNFSGIGTKDTSDTAFKGVIYGADHTITLTGGSAAFIKYGYGCVVRDVKFVLNQAPVLNRTEPARPDGVTTAKRAPDTFFGGVIGCVLGGDNIIENVTVTTDTDFKLDPTGSKTHLIPIGGHVGVIAGGGVIFRGTCTSNYADESKYYYRNPIIGRVLDGYAFYEGDDTAPDNGNGDYKINKIDPRSGDLSWNGSTLTVNNAQGLLILSGIVSSGAGSTQSLAYTYGVARNAAYDQIGKEEAVASSDFTLSQSDKAGTASYLLKHFSNCTDRVDFCTKFSDKEGIQIQFANTNTNTTFEMGAYGNGYRGLSARYVSNAAFTASGDDASAVVLRVKSFDGQGATVTGINIDVKEYDNDDFHAASLGGIFNIVWTKKQGGGSSTTNGAFAKDLTLQDCKVSLQYFNSNNEAKIQADKTTFVDADGLNGVTVGGFIGSVSDVEVSITPSKKLSNYLFSNIHIVGLETTSLVTGPTSAGGLIGASAMTYDTVTGYPGKLLSNRRYACFGPSFLNCSYNNVNITGVYAAGGLIGVACASTSAPHFGSLGYNYAASTQYLVSSTVTKENFILGKNSNITAKARTGMAGGIFGIAGMRAGVNYPNTGTETALPGLDENSMRRFSLNSVNIKSSLDTTKLYGSNGVLNGADNDAGQTASGGAIGRISNVNPTYFYDISLNNCQILSENSDTDKAYAGGIVSNGFTNTSITIQRCEVNQTTVSGVYTGGFLARGDNSGFALHLSDCKLENSTIKGRTAVGGIVGTAGVKGKTTGSQTYNLFNVLLKNTKVMGEGDAGRLFGWIQFNNASDNIKVNAVGISVFAKDSERTLPDQNVNYDNGKTFNGNIVYADYLGTSTSVDGYTSPYVTVNPNFTLSGVNKMLTGDAVGKIAEDTYGSVAARIWADQKTNATGKKNLVSYPKAAGIVNTVGKTAPEVSTFHEVQKCGPEDLPVLMIKGGNAGIIEDYLNVITNGGFSQAPKATESDTINKMDLKVSVYYYDKDADKFTEATDAQLKKDPASVYVDNGTLKVRGSSFDNTRNRFSLVEAKFNVTVNGKPRTYTVSVPVVVIRELQYNFMATFYYGAEFHADTFSELQNHLLESTGNPFTAYITYQYNREKTEFVDYDWQSYMDDGGSMLEVDKTLTFSSRLPKGTQLTLVDCQNGNRAYYHQISTDTATSVSMNLSVFVSACDENVHFQSSMADILRVTSAESATGKYVVETDAKKATVRLNGTYYRLYQDGDTGKRYDLTVPSNISTNVPEENYFLVITVPKQEDPNFSINGGLTSTLKWDMPSSVTQVHRYNRSDDKVGNNDESTYRISTGYQQELEALVEQANSGEMSSISTPMQVRIKDTITFSKEQAYNDNDKLFLKFTANLQEYAKEDSLSPKNEIQFPVGAVGTVYFYVQDRTEQYYKYIGDSWQKVDRPENDVDRPTVCAASYKWESNGANIELPLAKDGTTALDLAVVRQWIKKNDTIAEKEIIVTAEMDITFQSKEVLDATVPASLINKENGELDKWAQLHYVGQIATQANLLDFSASRTTAVDTVRYHRSILDQAILSMDASNINQLGINPLELVPEYLTNDRTASRIDLTAALDLSNLSQMENILQNTNSIRLTLSLQQRGQENGEINYQDVDEIGSYISFAWPNGSNDLSWTIQKDQFYQNGSITPTEIFNGKQFTIPITAYVNTTQTNYANYMIKLTAEFQTAGEPPIAVSVNVDDAYVVYTYACIKPTFYTPS